MRVVCWALAGAGVLLSGRTCPGQDEAVQAENRVLRAENNLLKKQLAEVRARLESATKAPAPAAGRTGATSLPTSLPSGPAQTTAVFALHESDPAWSTDSTAFATELLLRDSPLVTMRFPNEARQPWLARHNMFIGQPVQWKLGLLDCSPIAEEEAGSRYYRNLSELKPVKDKIAELQKTAPMTEMVRGAIAAEEYKARLLEAEAMAWKKVLDNKGGLSVRATFREYQGDNPVDVFLVRLVFPATEQGRLQAYQEAMAKANPELHATRRVWPIVLTGTVMFWGGVPGQPELLVDGTWQPGATPAPAPAAAPVRQPTPPPSGEIHPHVPGTPVPFNP